LTDLVLDTSNLPNRIWVAGMSLQRDPSPVSLLPRRFESKVRTSNLGMQIDRCAIDEGYPNILNKIDLSMQWRNVGMNGEVEDFLASLSNAGQPFDVALFKRESDFFDGDGTTKDFTLQRRVVGPQFFTDNPDVQTLPYFQLRSTRFSAQFGTSGVTETTITDPSKIVYKTAATIDTGGPASDEIWIEEDGHSKGNRLDTKIRLGTAPADGHDTLRITYIPLMRMFIASDSGRTFEAKLQMGRAFLFTEQ
jgi:hypothetical protein